MNILYESTGIIHYKSNPEIKVVLSVDQDIVEYYRSLIPKHIVSNRQLYSAHISVVRKEVPTRAKHWGKYEGMYVDFQYSPIIEWNDTYIWLKAYSNDLKRLRVELGLPPFRKGCDNFHITLGNFKKI